VENNGFLLFFYLVAFLKLQMSFDLVGMKVANLNEFNEILKILKNINKE